MRKTASHRVPAWLLRSIFLLAVLVSAAFVLLPTRHHVRAGQVLGLTHVALQQQLNQEMVPNWSYPELLTMADRACFDAPERMPIAILALQRVLEIDDRDGRIWARLAYAHAANHGRWTEASSAALRDSYFRMPYADREFLFWRLQLAEAYWDRLPRDIQALVLREAREAPPPWLRTFTPEIWSALPAPRGD